ncbi:MULTISPECIES: DUF411 domain-containing protein [Burkholderia]|jgi:hypothetical protein|uniref:DUF411 domain-containing protein n=3 Tax=Burkholderia cepacia complex TaxID=87882 RepID=A0AAP1VET1_9BURK|nr:MULTISPECIES: DUF411 domain-containing protein [Burkholderia]EKS9800601.1 DUF411 domain-containing protein [Burkholderia cepacia]EKS9807824.1 DUF411 domain-containing protein [Burkholderia cepacia]EKS9815424.1 DUF411 domain-containing protein [Burkholderia cepacia]EKS9821949.1 DUF411 domain-containing protein [Burkholderia cepacia]EKS9829574.1 DUF411 domain-containing protein [Burkholderia cepacia]
MRYLKMCLLMIAALGVQLSALAAEIPVKMYKNPNCGCCDAWAKDLAANGFKVETINTPNLVSIKKQYGVPESLEGCHTAIVGGYVVEGLVPANLVKRLLNEHPAIKGIALPGMPAGAPGMPGSRKGPLTVYELQPGPAPTVFANF